MLKGRETGPIVRHPLDLPFNHGLLDDSRGLLLRYLNALKTRMAPTADGPCILLRRSTIRSAKVWGYLQEIARL